jgi:hypothetical protein
MHSNEVRKAVAALSRDADWAEQYATDLDGAVTDPELHDVASLELTAAIERLHDAADEVQDLCRELANKVGDPDPEDDDEEDEDEGDDEGEGENADVA